MATWAGARASRMHVLSIPHLRRSLERGTASPMRSRNGLQLTSFQRIEVPETTRRRRELLAPYGEWAGLASRYLLFGWARGLVPLPEQARPPARFRHAAA